MSEVATNSSSNIIKVSEIGMAFGREYYTVLSREPSRLHLFYAKNSTLLHADEGDLDTPIVIGSDAIQSAVNKNSFLGSRFIIGSIDCHPSQNGGILVNVLGQIQKRGQANSSRHFMQTFFLAEQPSGYFILNENMRFLDRPAAATTTTATASTMSATEIAPITASAAPVPSVNVAVEAVTAAKPELIAESVSEIPTEAPAAPAKIKKITTAASKQKTSTSPVSGTSKAAAPVDVAVKEEAAPSGPSSWAQLAAGQTSKWASGVVSLNKGTSIQTEEKPKVIATSVSSSSNNRKKLSETNNSPAATTTTTTNNTTAPRRTADAPKQPTKLPFVPEASLYITGITPELKSDVLRAEFAALGALAHFDVKYNSGAAFVEYADASIAKILLEEGGIVINGTRLNVEKRRVATRNSHGGSSDSFGGKDKDSASKKFTPTKSNRRERPASKNLSATPATA